MAEQRTDQQLSNVSATGAALEVIKRLEAAHGALAFHQSGGCCEGSAAMCLRADELPPSPYDLRLGEIGGAPFYIDSDLYERWGRPEFVVDVAPGPSDGFSLEALEGVHFVTLTAGGGAACEVPPPSGPEQHSGT